VVPLHDVVTSHQKQMVFNGCGVCAWAIVCFIEMSYQLRIVWNPRLHCCMWYVRVQNLTIFNIMHYVFFSKRILNSGLV